MKLYLIRHAEAARSGENSEKSLTVRGMEQAAQLGRYLSSSNLDLVLSSPVLRAKQTAEIFCEVAQLGAPIEEAWLACGMGPERAKTELTSYQTFRSVVIVGHEPDLSFLLANLLGECLFEIDLASVTIVEGLFEEGRDAKLLDYQSF